MDILKDYELRKSKEGYELILYINPNDTEFAKEIAKSSKEVSKDLKKWLSDRALRLGPNIKIQTVKIMLGSLLLITIPIHAYAETNLSSDTAAGSSKEVFSHATGRFNMSYLYFGSPATQAERVHRTNNSLQVVSPSYFDLSDDGKLVLTPLVNTAFIKDMHNHNVKVVPFLSNHWDRNQGIKALENRSKLVNELAAVIDEYDLDGINVDIENVTHEHRDMYTDFVKQLREKLPPDKEVSVAVAANPNGWTKGWHGSYDYSTLANYADYLMIMAYDESYYGSDPGPVASHAFVERSIQYALKYAPPEKIVLGLSFYGRYWNSTQGIAGNGLHLTQVQEILNTYENTVTYDAVFQAPKATVTVRKGEPEVYVLGKPLSPGTYTIWYENNDSIKDKLMLVQKYNLNGTGSWSLGQELSDVWLYYNLYLNGRYFDDISQSWAKDEILSVLQKKYMVGISETKFAPGENLTRAQAAAVLVRALQLRNTNQTPNNFTDVPSSHWAKEYIDTIVSNGIMQGMTHNTFSPDTPLTREQTAMLLYRILESESSNPTSDHAFNDVEAGRWSENAINHMTASGMFKGYPDQTFRPAKSIERQEMAALMNRLDEQIDKGENP